MSLDKLQSVHHYFLNHPEEIEKYINNPSSLRDKFDLSEEDIDYLLSLKIESYKSEANIISGRRLHKILDFLPLIKQYFGADKSFRLIKEFNSKYPNTGVDNLEDILKFKEFLRKFADLKFKKGVSDLLNYEVDICVLLFSEKATKDFSRRINKIPVANSRLSLGNHIRMFRSKLNIGKTKDNFSRRIFKIALYKYPRIYLAVLEGIYSSGFIESIFSSPNDDIPEISVFLLNDRTEKFIKKTRQRKYLRMPVLKNKKLLKNLIEAGLFIES